jgi:hypothetical protein
MKTYSEVFNMAKSYYELIKYCPQSLTEFGKGYYRALLDVLNYDDSNFSNCVNHVALKIAEEVLNNDR